MGYHFKKLYALSDDSLSDKIMKLTDGNFDKVIFRKRLFIYIAMIGWYDDSSKNRREIKIIFS
jgi:hypothetical protein